MKKSRISPSLNHAVLTVCDLAEITGGSEDTDGTRDYEYRGPARRPGDHNATTNTPLPPTVKPVSGV